MKTGFLLVNLGTPRAPTPAAVRAYLAEFLSDPRVVQIPRVIWLPILHALVLRTRPRRSAAKYAAIWTDEGSPLAVHTARQAKLLRGLLGAGGNPVEYAMRYGEPRIADSMRKLRAAGCGTIKVLPLYPQYSESTTASIRDVIGAEAAMVRDFHDHPAYIAALAALVRRQWAHRGRGEKLLLSYHGLPQRSVDRGDPYKAQCETTSRLLAGELRLSAHDYAVSYQSRFGPARWIGPYTEPSLVDMARAGVREVDVLCPGFVSDCLETLEELGIGARAAFLGAGGNLFRLMPCLNEAPEWIAAMRAILEDGA